jgi:hypothetical protein
MRNDRRLVLDRVFARRGAKLPWELVPEVWAPPWRPRGRWWTRPHLPHHYRDISSSAARGWKQNARQPRAC